MNTISQLAQRRYERLMRTVVDFKLARKARIVTAIMFIAAVALLISLHWYEGQADFDRRFTVALFALLGAAFMACCAAVVELAAVIVNEIEAVKNDLRAADHQATEEENKDE